MNIGILNGLVLVLVNFAIAEFVTEKLVKRVKGSALSLAIVFLDFYFRLALIAVLAFIVYKMFGSEVRSALVTFAVGVTVHLFAKCFKELGCF